MVMVSGRVVPFPGRGAGAASVVGAAESEVARASGAALEQVLADVRRRWGHGSIVRLDGGSVPSGLSPQGRSLSGANGRRAAGGGRARDLRLETVDLRPRTAEAAGPPRAPVRRTRQEAPPWWPPAAQTAVVRPRILEIVGAAGSGRLALALTWMAAARPALAAVIDAGEHAFYPPAAVAAGVDLAKLLIVRPPPGEPRAALDAVVVLLRSEAFDVVLCPVAAGTRLGLTFGGKLATLAARSGTSLVLLTEPAASGRSAAGVLQAFADYRVRLARRRWLWADGELAGMKLRVATERARASAAGNGSVGEAGAAGERLQHDLTFRLHRLPGPGPVLRLERATQSPAGKPLVDQSSEEAHAERLHPAAARWA